jgi:aryl-alcohol dehydrogenase-like predicted oxidoreductase
MQLAGPNVWGLPDDPESARRVLRLAVELGVTFFDTANAYGPRTVNRLIGEALRPFPAGVIVGNKVGAGRGPDRSWIITGHPDTIRRQSGASPQMLARAQKMTPIAAVQNRFNLLDRSGVQVLADCEAQSIMFVPYFPLASGQLSSYGELTGPAERLGATPAQVALAWLLRRSPAMVVIPGTTNPDHLRANIAAAQVARNLTDAEVARLTGLVDESKAVIDQPRQSTPDALGSAAQRQR